MTEDLCKRAGLHIHKDGPLPGLKAIDGNITNNIIGRTGPLTITLAKGTRYPAVLPVNKGALVIKGSAGGLYDLCLDKQTLYQSLAMLTPR